MVNTKKYDYIIAGAGCAGLSLAVTMIKSGGFCQKKILIIDKERKTKNDRTWCFWETSLGLFEQIVYKKWKDVWIHSIKCSNRLSLFPYEYKLIKGIDFYNYCFKLISEQLNFEILYGNIIEINNEGQAAICKVNNEIFSATFIFSSILLNKPILNRNEYYLLQHFKGWVIETKNSFFNPNEAILMDFRTDQKWGTTFVYVLPYSKTKALVEFTLFSDKLLDSKDYENGLKKYISDKLGIDSFKVVDTEFGVIPMTNYTFPMNNGNIIFIGTAGGQTKGSSGYTFNFIQKHSQSIVDSLLVNKPPLTKIIKSKFQFYDSILLNILHNKLLKGEKIFMQLFTKNKPKNVLKFLDNESSLLDDIKIIFSLPKLPFIKAAIKQLFKV